MQVKNKETNTKKEYFENYDNLLTVLAQEAKSWANSQATFYKDGVFDPDIWFDEENTFRPLFILKEVNDQADETDEYINFIEPGNPKSDPWKGENMWKRLGILAAAMFETYETFGKIPNYDKIATSMKEEKENGENKHHSICRKIAIINLKKLPGGNNATSDKSRATLCFKCHAKHFHNKLIEQIRLINPNIIICCGINSVIECLGIKCTDKFITIGENKIPIINAYHPSKQVSTEKFYYKTLNSIKETTLFSVFGDPNEN